MREARYDVRPLTGSGEVSDVNAAEATRIVGQMGGSARVRFHGDTAQEEPVPWPLEVPETAGEKLLRDLYESDPP
jgi:hypothetical protein